MMHDKPIDGAFRVPWEPLARLGQIWPEKLPEPSETYSGPWRTLGRRSGHEDVIDAQGRVFAHVYCYNREEFEVLLKAIARSKEG